MREIEAGGGKAVARARRRRRSQGRRRAIAAAALAQFGRIDILVNNAALRREKPIAEMSYADWREVMDVTLDSAFHCVKACLPALRKNGGAIVNIGGMSAHIGSKHRAHVMTAKAGLVGFTRGLAHDLAADRIAVELRGPRRHRHAAAADGAEAGAPSHPRHHHRRARHLRGRRRAGAFPVHAGGAFRHRPGHPRQWRRVSGAVDVITGPAP